MTDLDGFRQALSKPLPLSEQTTTYLIRHLLEQHDRTTGELFSEIARTHEDVTANYLTEMLQLGINDGLIEQLDDGTWHWKGVLPEGSAVQRWESWLHDLEHSQRPILNTDLSVTLRSARSAIAELQGQLAAVRHFAEVWAELIPDLPDNYSYELTCTEANAAFDFFVEMGMPKVADAVIDAHSQRDDPGDEHYDGEGDGTDG